MCDLAPDYKEDWTWGRDKQNLSFIMKHNAALWYIVTSEVYDLQALTLYTVYYNRDVYYIYRDILYLHLPTLLLFVFFVLTFMPHVSL